MSNLETAALNGSLFQLRSTSPTRSASTASPANTDDEGASDVSAPASPSNSTAHLRPRPSAGGTGAQTGPKGVIEDRKQHASASRAERHAAVDAKRADQERRKIVALTVDEEARLLRREELERVHQESLEDAEARQRWRAARRDELERRKEDGGEAKKGLREVGKEGFVWAVERAGWVVVLIYAVDIPRCQTVLASMLNLSLSLPASQSLPTPVHLFRARASSLEFSLLPEPNPQGDEDEDDEDDYFDDAVEAAHSRPKGKPDPDVLPTMLAYRDGELAKTWIRVDWEVTEDGVEGLLRRQGILPPLSAARRNWMDEDDDPSNDHTY